MIWSLNLHTTYFFNQIGLVIENGLLLMESLSPEPLFMQQRRLTPNFWEMFDHIKWNGEDISLVR